MSFVTDQWPCCVKAQVRVRRHVYQALAKIVSVERRFIPLPSPTHPRPKRQTKMKEDICYQDKLRLKILHCQKAFIILMFSFFCIFFFFFSQSSKRKKRRVRDNPKLAELFCSTSFVVDQAVAVTRCLKLFKPYLINFISCFLFFCFCFGYLFYLFIYLFVFFFVIMLIQYFLDFFIYVFF